jgi:Ca2+-binding RTX toxin-like protein
MPETDMPNPLNSLYAAILADPGLKKDNPWTQIKKGLDAADRLDDLLMKVIGATGVNGDGQISKTDMMKISDVTYHTNDYFRPFILSHGNDAGRTTAFHWVQNDGGTLVFQGRAFIDTVADAIYHYGFQIRNGRYFNEDGNDNETAVDVAGWLNYFLNGENIVYGSGHNDELGSGKYSNYFAKARSETFLAGDGRDKIWADVGNDKVYGGSGNDVSGGGRGGDRMYGEAGKDTLYGEDSSDRIYGGTGDDVLSGGNAADRLFGGDDQDTVYGDNGADRIYGGAGGDELSGGGAGDRLYGGIGRDKLMPGDAGDRVDGGTGADDIYLWETHKARDTIVFRAGDSGRTAADMDVVEGFQRGSDKIDMRSFGPMVLAGDDFKGNGAASCRFVSDGEHSRLLIDANGDSRTDMAIQFTWLDTLRAGDFIFA